MSNPKTPKEWDKYWIKQKKIRVKRVDNQDNYRCDICEANPSEFLFKIKRPKSQLGFVFFYFCESCRITMHEVLHHIDKPKTKKQKRDRPAAEAA